MISYERALNILGERTLDNTEMLRRARRQRRTEYSDIYGVPLESEDSSKRQFVYHIFVSPDFEYWERWQFKLNVSGAGEDSFDEEQFKFEIAYIKENEGTELPAEEKWDDITAELIEQHENAWVTGDGYYPTEEISDEADAEDFYDILDACTVLYSGSSDEQDEANRILSAGTKKIRVTAPVDCKVIFYPYVKYSTINR